MIFQQQVDDSHLIFFDMKIFIQLFEAYIVSIFENILSEMYI